MPTAIKIAEATAPLAIESQILKVEHIRSAHYGVYRVISSAGSLILRIGVTDDTDQGIDNSGYLGTSVLTPSGQRREYLLARNFAAQNGLVCTPIYFSNTVDGYDAMWLANMKNIGRPVTAKQWHKTLTSLYGYKPSETLPVFTNRAKSHARLKNFPDRVKQEIKSQYDKEMKRLFSAATHWSVVHGDAHGENVANDGKHAFLYDFDTACWAPSVWDLSHLLTREGSNGNCGYTAAELRNLFPFTSAEVDAAIALRKSAIRIAILAR